MEPELVGDTGFVGVNTRVDPGSLTPGIASHANNMRFRNGIAETRKGVIKPAWLNSTKPELYKEVRNWGKVYGVGNFKDPDSSDFVLIAADGDVYQTRQNNTPVKLALPDGEKVLQDCQFVQAFDKVIIFRGRNFKPLVMTSIDDGFAYMLDDYAAATGYASGNEVSYGPFIAVTSITNSATTKACTVTTPNDHNLISNQAVTIAGATEPSTVPIATSLARTSQLATVTQSGGHPFSTGDYVVIAGVSGATGTYTYTKFNGTFQITKISSTVFTYNVPYDTSTDSVSSTATGSPTYREIGYNGRHQVTVTGDKTFTYNALSNITTTSAAGTVTASLNSNFYKRNHPKSMTGLTVTAAGTYTALPTVTINPAKGTVVSVVMQVKSVTITAAGSGYSAGDVLSIAGGTASGTATIKAVSVNGSGVIQTAEIQYAGKYTAIPSGAVSVSGGAGTSATFTLGWEVDSVTMSNTGTGHFTNPTVTFSASGGDVAATGTPVLGVENITLDETTTGTAPTDADHWTQVSNIMPNSSSATYVQNRLVVASAYNTGTFSSDAKVDYIYASDILDEVHTYATQIFRANKGSDEEIVDIAKVTGNQIVIFKNRSVDLVTSFYAGLSDVRIDTLIPDVGLAAPRAYAVVGPDVFFFAGRKGVMSIRQNDLSSYQGVSLPLSESIHSLIDRIDHRQQDKVRMSYHDNKLYVAVPFKDLRTQITQNLLTTTIYPDSSGQPQPLVYSGLTVGNTYSFRLGKNETSIEVSSPAWSHSRNTDGSYGEFTAAATSVSIVPNPNGGSEVTAQLMETAYGQGNNALLVFDFLNQEWTGYDTGTDICVKEFFKANYNSTERLFFAGVDGYINLIEEGFSGDESFNGTTDSQLGITPISCDMTTRGYQSMDPNARMIKKGRVNLQTWYPKFSIKVLTDGVEESQTVVSDRTKSRTKYYRPSYQAEYVVSNTNDDHGTPYRQDYSIQLTTAGTAPKTGIDPNRMQESQETFSASPRRGRYGQMNISNTQGRVGVTSVNLDTYGGNKTYNSRA